MKSLPSKTKIISHHSGILLPPNSRKLPPNISWREFPQTAPRHRSVAVGLSNAVWRISMFSSVEKLHRVNLVLQSFRSVSSDLSIRKLRFIQIHLFLTDILQSQARCQHFLWDESEVPAGNQSVK